MISLKKTKNIKVIEIMKRNKNLGRKKTFKLKFGKGFISIKGHTFEEALRDFIPEDMCLGRTWFLDFSGVDIEGINLSGLKKLQRTYFSGADMDGINLSQSDLRRSNFSGAIIDGGNLSGANLEGCRFAGALLRNVHFEGANLTGCDFSGAWLVNCDFSGADLSKTKFAGSKLENIKVYGAKFSDSDIRGAKISRLDSFQTNYSRSKFGSATLENCSFYQDLFGYSKFIGVDLISSFFEAVELIETDFAGASPKKCSFKDIAWEQAINLEQTVECDCAWIPKNIGLIDSLSVLFFTKNNILVIDLYVF